MKIALIGASGFVGAKLLDEALRRGHRVTAIVRHPKKLASHAALTAKAADAYDAGEIAAAVADHDIVLSAFNPGWSEPDIQAQHVRGSRAIVEGVKRAGVPRLVVIGGAGSLFAAPGVQLVDTPQFPAEWKEGALGARQALRDLQAETSLDWTFVSPPALLEPGERTGKYRLGGDELLMDGDHPAKISVEDLAVAVLDEIEDPKHSRRRFTAASAV